MTTIFSRVLTPTLQFSCCAIVRLIIGLRSGFSDQSVFSHCTYDEKTVIFSSFSFENCYKAKDGGKLPKEIDEDPIEYTNYRIANNEIPMESKEYPKREDVPHGLRVNPDNAGTPEPKLRLDATNQQEQKENDSTERDPKIGNYPLKESLKNVLVDKLSFSGAAHSLKESAFALVTKGYFILVMIIYLFS
jgi:hypothetical protein